MRFLARLLLAAALIAPHQALALDPGKVPPVTPGTGSTGDVSNTSVTVNGTTQSLQSWLPTLAPLASPTFKGTAQIGSTVYPASATPVTTTATGAKGGTTITVASTAGIKVGATAYGAGISGGCQTKGAAFQGTFVTAISGATITLSCPLVGRLSNTSVQFGVQRNDPAATTLTNTVMAREGLFGGASQGASTAWLGQIVTGQDYPATGVLKAVSMPGTPGGLVVASRTSDATNGAGIYPFYCLYLADSWATTHDGSCGYWQSNLMPATAGLYAHIQAESSVNTLWPATEVNPFKLNAVNSTTHHRFDCGTGQSGANAPNNCSTVFDFPANGAQIKTIATVYAGAMDTTGRIPQFASLPPGVAIATWWSSAGTRSWDIVSTATGGYGSLTLRNNSAGFFSDLTLDAGTNGGRSLNWTRAGNPNFSFGQSNDAAGNLSVSTFNDVGGFVSTPFQIRRGDGQVTIKPLVVTGSLTIPFGTPASSKAPCSPGQISVDATYIYTCVAANSWHRTSNGGSW